MPPGTTIPPEKLPAKPKGPSSWNHLRRQANSVASIIVFIVFLITAGAIAGYFYFKSREAPVSPQSVSISNLSPSEISKLSEISTNLGTAGQTLNIGADTLLRGKVDIGGDLSVAGHLNANGPVTLSQLNITGTTAATGLNVGSNLNVTGNTTMQQSLSVGGLATFASGINVGGNAGFNALNANTISVRNISISGPLTISHLTTQGPTPGMAAGTAVGGGGTASISGNDSAGTLNFNTGNTPPAGVLGTITFRGAYTSTVHVLLTPLTSAAAGISAYVTRTNGGFQVHVATPPPGGSTISFDYFVTQ